MELAHEQHHGIDTWVVQLPEHAPYTFTRLKRLGLSDDSLHRVVIVDPRKLLACADRDTADYVLPLVQYWHSGKMHGIQAFLDPEQDRIPEMLYVTFSVRHTHTALGLPWFSKEGVVSFRNGQHRARYIAFAGAASMPVEVHESEAELLRQYCGA